MLRGLTAGLWVGLGLFGLASLREQAMGLTRSASTTRAPNRKVQDFAIVATLLSCKLLLLLSWY